MQILAGQVFPPSLLLHYETTLGSLVVCGVGVQFVGRGCWLRVAVVGAFGRQGARKETRSQREKPTRRARLVGHTRILPRPPPRTY